MGRRANAERNGSGNTNRINVRLTPNLREALEELQAKKFEKEGLDLALADLMVQGTVLLLRQSGIAVERGNTPLPTRKPPKSAKGKTMSTAVEP